jgi:alpha-tubulin suppressor-like RCC1 family protein
LNEFGQLGSSAVQMSASSVTPVAVDGLSSATFVAAGNAHTCANSGDVLYCWGQDGVGQLGNGSASYSQPTPVTVSGLSGASAVGIGYYHTCAVTGGTVQCWGNNAGGSLGVNNQTTPFSTVPVTVTGISDAR